MDSLQKKYRRNKIMIYGALTLGAVLMIFPFIWMLLTSFKSPAESVQIPPTILYKGSDQPSFCEAVSEYNAFNCISSYLRCGFFFRSRLCLCKTPV